MERLSEFQQKIGYEFQDERLLVQALTHSSYANEHGLKLSDNERLEFLGDAVLEVLTSDYLYRLHTDWPEGELTKYRASIVCEQTLAFCARKISLGEYLRLGKGEEHMGGRKRPSIVSDAFEAVIGAIYLDSGFGEAEKFIRRFVLDDIDNTRLFYDSKTILQEMVQAEEKGSLSYHLLGETGPDHNKSFHVEARIGDQPVSRGEGHTKKAAEQEAAYRAILILRNQESDSEENSSV